MSQFRDPKGDTTDLEPVYLPGEPRKFVNLLIKNPQFSSIQTDILAMLPTHEITRYVF